MHVTINHRTMTPLLRQKRAAVEVALRRNRESTYTEPIMKKSGQPKSPEEIDEIKSYLTDFYKTIYKRNDECHTILKDHPNTVAVHFANLVPSQISYEDFWQRYFFRCSEERIISEWDRAAEKARKERAVRVEEFQQSLQKSIRNIQDTLEVAAGGGANVPAGGGHARGASSVGKDAFLPPLLGPDAPDVKTTPLTKPDANASTVEENKIPDREANVSSGRISPAPKTAAGEKTRENESTPGALTLTPAASREEEPQKPQTLQEMVAAANEVERNSPRSRQVRVVSPKTEPKVISFWKNPGDGDSSPSNEDLSIPNLVKENSAAKEDASSSVAKGAKRESTTIPHDLKRTGSKVADRELTAPKKRKVDLPAAAERGEPDLNKSSKMSNTSVILLLLPAIIGLLIAMLFNSDLACAAAKPGKNLSGQDFYSEAPFWASPAMKKDIFSLVCPGRVRTSLEWTAMGGGRGKSKLYRLTLRDLDALGGSKIRPLYDKRNLESGAVSPTFITVINKKESKEKIGAPWAL